LCGTRSGSWKRSSATPGPATRARCAAGCEEVPWAPVSVELSVVL
jgi:hypothetical protein